MEILRAPEGATDGLADYPTERRFVEIPAGDGQQLRVHLVDAGDPEAPVVVFLHGNPSWSFLWRSLLAAAAPSTGARSSRASVGCPWR